MKKKITAIALAVITAATFALSGCTKAPSAPAAPTVTPSTDVIPSVAITPTDVPARDYSVKPETDNFVELAVNVYYNDVDTSYYSNEVSTSSIYVTEAGQYTLTFDCERDLSVDAKAKGVSSLTNLTAIYLLDMGTKNGSQSPITACNIKFDEVLVDGKPLTITQKEAKSAIKSSGVFDTNDPINAWDGSQVEEVAVTSEHVANFTTVQGPKVISITFTLSDLEWGKEDKPDDTPVVSKNTYINVASYSDIDFDKTSSIGMAKLMGNGINLGNTMEAYGRDVLGTNAPVSSYETFWGQPVTTAAMVKGMKNCGFDTLRIPVAWTNMMNYESGDYTINPKLLDRVEEIVNYAIDAQMFVIINDHWDGGWWGMFGSKNPETVDKAFALYTSMWTQIAERFKDYPELLVFESANEELGNSLNDNTLCADSGYLSEDGKYEMTNRINQTFVDTIRASGGKNAKRFLLIAGFNTDIDKTCDDRFKMPTDVIDKKLLLSVHYYTPWNYCGAEKDAKWGLKSEMKAMEEQINKLSKFSNDYGIVIGEYGALPVYDSETGTHTLKSNTDVFNEYFLDCCDSLRICPVLWSCNDFYNKRELTMITDEMLDFYISRCYIKEAATGEPQFSTMRKERMKKEYNNAPDMWDDVKTYEPGTPVAWIMWNGGAGTYSVGDTFNPADNTAGIVATNVVVSGAGSYKVSLDFEGGNTGLTFAALAIADCELIYPGSVIKISGIYADGQKLALAGQPYTSSDDGICTRVNLYNQWVTNVPNDARTASGFKEGCTASLINPTDIVNVKNITIEFVLITK